MTGLTVEQRLAEVKTRLANYIQAEADILKCGESYSISDRSLSRADLRWVKEEIKKLQKECDRLENGSLGITTSYIIPRNT